MDKKVLNLLILEDNPDDVVLILKELERDGFTVKCNRVETKKAFKEALAEKPGIILSDYQVPSFNGKAALQTRKKLTPDIPMIIVSGSVDKKDAIECMKCGAVDYVLKDNLSQLGKAVDRALKEADERLQRKRTEEKIMDSEERFRILFESAKDGFFLLDKNWKYIDVNPAYCRMFGYSRDEFLQSDMMLVFFLYDIENAFEDSKSIRKDKYFFPEYRMRKKDKSEIWVDLTITPFNAGGKELILGIIRDVTERKRTGEALRKSEELFRTIVETAPSFLTITDEKGDNIYVSPNCEEITGYTQEELHGKWIWSVHEDDTPRAKKLFDKTFSEGIGYKNFEYKFVTKKGELRYALSSWDPLKDKNGKFKGIVLQTIDVTKRKRVEGKLIESEEKYRTLVENIQDGVFLIQDRKLLFVNEAFAGIAGCTIEEIIGKGFSKFVALEDLDMVRDRHDRRMAGEDVPMEYEFHIIQKKGDEQRIVNMNVGLVNFQGKKAALGTIRDITESKRTEQTLRESRERLDFAVTGANLGLWDWNLQTGDAVYSKQWAEMLGYSIKEIESKSRSWEKLIHADDLSKVTEISEAHFEGKTPFYKAEFRIRAKSGEWKWILSTGKVFEWDEAGKPLRMTGLHQDITERKHAEEKLIESEEKYRQLAETAKDIILLSDLKGNVKYANREGLRVAGYSEKETLQMNVMDMLTKDCIPATKERFKQRQKGKNDIFVYDAEFFNKKGYKIPVEVKSSLITEQGKPSGVLIIARDITGRKQSEKRIERLNNALKAVRSVDKLIIVEKYRNSLLQKACDIMIETRGYEGAWLGLLKDEKNFGVVKGSGLGEDVSRFINHVISGDHPRCIRNALSGSNSFILIDKSKDCGKCFFKKPCAGKEAAIIHVEHDGRLFGLMAILFAVDISVDDEEKELLKELAGDIGLALYNMELKESSKRSEEALKHKLLALSQPVYEIRGLQLTDIIDIDILQKLQDDFAESYGVASLIFDNNGKPITTPSNFSDFCKIIRSTKKGMERCQISDENLTRLAAKNASVITPCRNFKGILDAAVPVFIGDKQVAAWGAGQKLIGELSEDKVRGYAKEIGADAKQLIAASKKLEKGSKEQFERIVSFIKTIAKNISLLGLQNIQQAREITERKRAEETLKESEDKYRRLTETVTDIIFTLNEKGEFTYLSPVFEKVTGYPALNFLGRPFTEVITPEYKESTVEKFKSGLAGEKIPLYEIELIHKDKRRIPVELNVTSLLDSRGQIIGRHGVARDITIRKQSEEELRKKNEELEIFNKMAVGRELKMIELKKEINQLLIQSGNKARYKIADESKAEESK